MSAVDQKKSPRFKNPQIACSAFCGLACVLLIVLWVRSYQLVDSIDVLNPLVRVELLSARGEIAFGVERFSEPFHPRPVWKYESYEPDYAEPFPTEWMFGFYAEMRSRGFAIYSPFWFLVLVHAISAAAPWFRWSKQSSLRTLLIATTLIALLVGLAAYATR